MAESSDAPDLGWIKPLDAVGVCQRLFGLSEQAARQRLIFLARNDRILRTFCTHFQRRWFDGYGNDDEFEDETLLPTFWIGFDSSQWPTDDWRNGLFSFKTMDHESIAHGVRFSQLDLINYKRKLDGKPPLTSLPPPPPPPPPPKPPQISRAPAPIPELRTYRRAPPPSEEMSLGELMRRREASGPVGSMPADTLREELEEKIHALAREAFGGTAPTARRGATDSPRAPDSELEAWYRRRRHQFPDEVHHEVKAAFHADTGRLAGKNQLYRIMRKVSGGPLKAGNPSISRAKSGKLTGKLK